MTSNILNAHAAQGKEIKSNMFVPTLIMSISRVWILTLFSTVRMSMGSSCFTFGNQDLLIPRLTLARVVYASMPEHKPPHTKGA